jgi:UDP-glucose 4-epimerase
MKVIVTGGAGFIGSHLVDALIARGDEVVVVDVLFRGLRENINSKAIFIEGNVCDYSVLTAAVSELGGVDLIHHLAAINGTKWFHEAAAEVISVNINATHRVIELALEHDARLVIASSPEAYGEQKVMPLSEQSEAVFSPAHLHQRHSYGASKYLDEVAIQHAVRSKDLDGRIVRPFNAYGPRLPSDEYGQVIAIMLAKAKSGQDIEVHGDGQQTRSFTWIHDVIEGMLLVSDQEGLAGKAFNLGRDEEISILDLAERIAALGSAKIVMQGSYHGDSTRRLPDLTGNQLISWRANTSLSEGLALMNNEL